VGKADWIVAVRDTSCYRKICWQSLLVISGEKKAPFPVKKQSKYFNSMAVIRQVTLLQKINTENGSLLKL
jgi:hypothetical protein